MGNSIMCFSLSESRKTYVLVFHYDIFFAEGLLFIQI